MADSSSGIPSWAMAGGAALAGMFVYRMLSGGVDDMLALPDRVAKIEVRADNTDATFKNLGTQIDKLIAVQEKLEAERIKREAQAAEEQRRRLDDAERAARERDDQRRAQRQEERAADRAAMRESLREALIESESPKHRGR